MKRLTNMMGMALICAAIACNDSSKTSDSIESKPDSSSTATTAVADETPKAADSAAMMKAWMDYMTPGAMHSMLAKDNGAWTADVTMWMGPDAPAQKSTGTIVYKMIMGGRYQQGNFTGNFNGMPFEGMSLVGYDNAKKTFVSTWIDNMGTGFMNLEGSYDSTNHTVNFTGKQIDPMNGKECTLRQTFTKVDDNTTKEEMYAQYKGGKEYKSMEIISKKKK